MYDLIVVGAGPAGYEAALKASALDKKVLLIEKDRVGGTCLNYGCIPTKSLLAQTKKFKELLSSPKGPIKYNNLVIDYPQVLYIKDKTVDRLRKGVELLLKKQQVDLVIGNATLINSNTVKVDDTEYSGKYILLALGARSATLNIPGFHNCIDSRKLLDTDISNVKEAVIIGGGVIGVEIATLLNNLNIKVTIIEAENQLILNGDRDAADRLKRLLNRSKVKVELNTFVTRIEYNKAFTDEKVYEGDLILSCIGRVPNTENFDLNGSLKIDRGYIEVDTNFKTTVDNIYAVGDCVKGYQLAHYARACAINVVSNLFSSKQLYNLNNVPRCIYTSDEIASVGNEASEDDIVVKRDFTANPRSLIDNQNRGFVKLVFTKEGLFKGATIMSVRASDMINVFITALNNNLTIEELVKDIYPHPSFVEEVGETLLEAFNKFEWKFKKDKKQNKKNNVLICQHTSNFLSMCAIDIFEKPLYIQTFYFILLGMMDVTIKNTGFN